MVKLKECCILKRGKEDFSHALFKPKELSCVVVISHFGCVMRNSLLYQREIKNMLDFVSYKPKNDEICKLPDAMGDNKIDALVLSKDGCQFAVTSCTSATTFDGDWRFGCPEYLSIFGDHFFECCYSNGTSPPDHERNVAAFSPDGKQIVAASSDFYDAGLYFIDCPTTANCEPPKEQDLNPIEIPNFFLSEPLEWPVITSLDWAAKGDLIAAGGPNGVVLFYCSIKREPLFYKKIFNASIEHLMFSPDGSKCALLSADGDVVVLDIPKEFL